MERRNETFRLTVCVCVCVCEVELELEMLKKQQASVAEGNPLVTTEEVNALR